MKKALALLLALCLVFALAACGQEGAQTSEPPASEAPEETPGEDITRAPRSRPSRSWSSPPPPWRPR
ncbi:MAG: hypothetical protein ACLTSG_13265 [Lachnospiraceae bacterium]